MKLCLILPFLLLSSCAAVVHPMTLSPTVYIDERFTQDERASIEDGLRRWEYAVADISFTVTYESHEQLEFDGPDNSIIIERVQGQTDPSCQGQTLKHFAAEGESLAGFCQNHEWPSTYSRICLDADYTDSHGRRWAPLTMHEVGHALRLSHMAQPSVMAPTYQQIADFPTCKDREAIATYWQLREQVTCD